MRLNARDSSLVITSSLKPHYSYIERYRTAFRISFAAIHKFHERRLVLRTGYRHD
jgi:hypothetical protein